MENGYMTAGDLALWADARDRHYNCGGCGYSYHRNGMAATVLYVLQVFDVKQDKRGATEMATSLSPCRGCSEARFGVKT